MTDHAPPDYLSGDARVVWDETVLSIEGRWTAATTRQLALYCDMVVQYEQATDLAARSGSLIRGHDGSMRKNPALGLAQDLAETIRTSARELGLASQRWVAVGANEKAVLQDLDTRRETAYGQLAITLARELDAADDPSSAAMVARELRLLLVEINKSVPDVARSELDDLRARRAARENTG